MEPSTQIRTAELTDLRRRRAELRESMGIVEEALASPAAGRSQAWSERVHHALSDLADDFIDHVVVTEGPEGLHQSILAGALRLTNAVNALAAEHADINREVTALVSATGTDSALSAEQLEDIRDRATRLLGHLARHRQRGADLIYEAYQTDIGGGD